MTDRSLLRARVTQYLHARQITAQCYLVALALIRHVNRQGTAWPSEVTLASHVGCTERSVRRHKRTLERIGMLRWARRRRTSCLYRLSLPPIWHTPEPLSLKRISFRDSRASMSAQESPAVSGALARLAAAMGIAADQVMPWLTPLATPTAGESPARSVHPWCGAS